jgi:6-pyruvoyl-tetrahydropterin synthase
MKQHLFILALFVSFLIPNLSLSAQMPPQPNQTVLGIGHGINEKESVAKAERDAVRIAVMNVTGPAMQDPKIQKFIDKLDAKQILTLAEGKKSVKTRKENNEYITESIYTVNWQKLKELLQKDGIPLAENRPVQPRQDYPETVRGEGRAKDEKTARDKAIQNTVRIALDFVLGPQSPMNQPQIDRFIQNCDWTIFMQAVQNPPVNISKEGSEIKAEFIARVNWPILREQAKTIGVPLAGEMIKPPQGNNESIEPGQAGNMQNMPGKAGSGEMSVISGLDTGTAADWGNVSEEEKNIILKYIDTLSFMVYYNENSLADKTMLKAAVSQANTVLTRAGITVFDINRVEKLKSDQRTVYESSQSDAVSLIQWVAQKLNADIYVQVDVITGEKKDESTSSETDPLTIGVLTTDLFDASTGQLLGSSSINIIAKDTNQAKEQMKKSLVRGMRYELIIQNTQDSRLMSSFLTAMKPKTKQIKVLSSSPAEYRYEVYYIGLLSDLEALIYSVSEKLPGLENISLVMASGKSLVMDTGNK